MRAKSIESFPLDYFHGDIQRDKPLNFDGWGSAKMLSMGM